MNVAGIDYSTHAVDVVLLPLDDGPPVWHRFPLTGSDAFDRTRSVADAMPGRSSQFWDSVLACGIEHPGGHHGTRDMLRVQGAILSCLPPRLLVEPWPPAKWRKAVGLRGNATKGDVWRESTIRVLPEKTYLLSRDILEKWPFAMQVTNAQGTDWPQDAHDAHLIALATRQAIRTEKAA